MIHFLVSLLVLVFSHGYSASPDSTIFRTVKSKDTIQVNKEWIPKNLEECFKRLNEVLPDSLKLEIKNGTEKAMSQYHHGLGTYIRNNWGLWEDGKLTKYFNKMGVFHPDGMSGIILHSYWRKLNGKPIQLKEQVEYYKNSWKVGSGPKSYKSKLCPEEIEQLGSFCLDEEIFKGVCREVFLGYCKSKTKYLAYEWNKGWYKADSSFINRFNERNKEEP